MTDPTPDMHPSSFLRPIEQQLLARFDDVMDRLAVAAGEARSAAADWDKTDRLTDTWSAEAGSRDTYVHALANIAAALAHSAGGSLSIESTAETVAVPGRVL